jgi:2-polyprenyl-6-methoxyphenol hydroxylase-like FAD-dependent oxidoreductase
VRALIDAPVADLGFFYDWLIVDVVLDTPRTFDPVNLQICDPSRPTTVVSGGPGRRRWEFMRLPHESLDDLNDAGRAWELLAGWDVTPSNATIERHAVYTFAASCVEVWRDGCVLLAGDAAHQMPPFAGQGMGAGVRDAANLAWKLDLVLAGRAGDALLDTYATERRPDARVAIDFSIELGKVICVPDPEEAAVRDEAMGASVGADPAEAPDPPALADGLLHPTAPLAGLLFCQGVVDVGGRRGRFDDVHGSA